MICPFFSKKVIKKEIKYDAEGKIIEEKEIPSWEPVECRKEECMLYEREAGRCGLLPSPETKELRRLGSIEERLRELRDGIERVEMGLTRGMEEVKSIKETVFTGIGDLRERLERLEEKAGKVPEKMDEVKEKVRDIFDAAVYRISSAMGEGRREIKEEIKEVVKVMEEEKAWVKERMDELREKISEMLSGLAEEEKKVGELLERINEWMKRTEETERERRARELNDRAVLLYYAGNPDGALKEIERALELNPSSASAWLNKGIILSGKGEKDKAIEAMKHALELSPDLAEAYNALGVLYHEEGEISTAVEYFRKAVEKKQNFALAYRNLGFVLKEMGNLDEAIKAWERALELDETLEDVRDALSVYREGRIDHA